MAKGRTDDQTGPVAVVEHEVDVEKAESELKAAGKKLDDAPEHTNGHKPIARSQFLFAAKGYVPKVEIVTLPAPLEGQQLKVRELRAGERDSYENRIVRGRLGNQKIDMTELRIGLIVAAAVDWDDHSLPLFQESDKEILRNMGISVIQAIYNVARKLSDVSDEDEKELMGE